MNRIVSCWASAEKRAKHLCAFETLGLNFRLRKPSQEEVKKAWRQQCILLHPDRNVEHEELATEATRCINLAKQYLFEVHFGGAAARVTYKHEPDKEEAQAREAAEQAAAKEAAEAAEVAAVAAQQARLSAGSELQVPCSQQQPEPQRKPPPPAPSSSKRPAEAAANAAAVGASADKRQRGCVDEVSPTEMTSYVDGDAAPSAAAEKNST